MVHERESPLLIELLPLLHLLSDLNTGVSPFCKAWEVEVYVRYETRLVIPRALVDGWLYSFVSFL